MSDVVREIVMRGEHTDEEFELAVECLRRFELVRLIVFWSVEKAAYFEGADYGP